VEVECGGGKMKVLVFAFLLLAFAYVVFRRIVRRDYLERGKLSLIASILQLLVFCGFFSFPYLFNPPEWPYFWRLDSFETHYSQLIGLSIICLGFLVAFGTMAWFGIGKAFGLNVDVLIRQGPYKISRNPQILGGYFLVIGTAIQRLSLYSSGWVILYAVISYWMIITEEEHLSRVYGEEYEKYCFEIPRYLIRMK
jgi:protein-S-isoprenylcysteine O-methyltransferase Ste14